MRGVLAADGKTPRRDRAKLPPSCPDAVLTKEERGERLSSTGVHAWSLVLGPVLTCGISVPARGNIYCTIGAVQVGAAAVSVVRFASWIVELDAMEQGLARGLGLGGGWFRWARETISAPARAWRFEWRLAPFEDAADEGKRELGWIRSVAEIRRP